MLYHIDLYQNLHVDNDGKVDYCSICYYTHAGHVITLYILIHTCRSIDSTNAFIQQVLLLQVFGRNGLWNHYCILIITAI